MNTRTLRTALLLVSGLAGQALAQPTPEGPVSEINGQLVKVGEHTDYLYSFKRWNVSTNPLGWMVGSYGASLSYALGENVALRADLNIVDLVDSEDEGFVELGGSLPIYFRRVYSGPFLEPGLIIRRTTGDLDPRTILGPQVLFGWHWTWDSGLNIAVAGGLGRNWSAHDERTYEDGYYDDNIGDRDDKVFFNGYLRFGYEW